MLMTGPSWRVLWISCVFAVCSIALNCAIGGTLAFIKNCGQWDSRALYRAEAGNLVIWLTTEGVYYQFFQRVDSTAVPEINRVDRRSLIGDRQDELRMEQLSYRCAFVNANPAPQAFGTGELRQKHHFYIGDDPSGWRVNVPSYAGVTIAELYPGIDVTFYSADNGSLEYDFVVSPGADYRQIKLAYQGACELALVAEREILVKTPGHSHTEKIPSIYQVENGRRRSISGSFVLSEPRLATFELSADYDPTKPVVIDPKLEYSSYLASAQYEFISDIAVDAFGAAYVFGRTNGISFPQLDSVPVPAGPSDLFVTRLTPDGAIDYVALIGGSDIDNEGGIDVDAQRRAYLCGYTFSDDYPRENSFLPLHNGNQCVYSRLSADGSSLEYSGYIGGSNGSGTAEDITVDADFNAYIVGATSATDFPVLNAFQPNLNPSGYGIDAFVLKLNPTGSGLVLGTYLGGSGSDLSLQVALTADNRVIVAGATSSADFPKKRPFFDKVPSQYDDDVFVSGLSATGDSLLFSSVIGTTDTEFLRGLAVDDSGCAFVSGWTWSPYFPTRNSVLPYICCDGVFLFKVGSAGDSLVFSTVLSSSGDEQGFQVAESNGQPVIVGQAGATDFPQQEPFQPSRGADGFISKFTSNGDSLIFSTCFGGSAYDAVTSVAVGPDGAIYVAGFTLSPDFPVLNAFQHRCGDWDGFVAKFTDDFECGDVDANDSIDLTDIVGLVNYIFIHGDQPNPYVAADADCNGIVTISDAVYLINYIFGGGPAPCASCP